ncbi:MAG: helix-hairpin-helix domain-containing protein [Candidatus Kapabacteria bacterium]|nr:helix-hairpin-helix domain-containing protein [Candidatus Kapabacteria bacterium]
MKRFLTYLQRHLSVTRPEALAVSFVATVLTVGAIGTRLWPVPSTHDHVSAQRIAQILDSLESERNVPFPDSTLAHTEVGHEAPYQERPSHPAKSVSGPINLNTASVSQLEGLPGIGPAMALRIVEARRRREFTCVDDLLNVKGIGEKKLAKLRPYAKVP